MTSAELTAVWVIGILAVCITIENVAKLFCSVLCAKYGWQPHKDGSFTKL